MASRGVEVFRLVPFGSRNCHAYPDRLRLLEASIICSVGSIPASAVALLALFGVLSFFPASLYLSKSLQARPPLGRCGGCGVKTFFPLL